MKSLNFGLCAIVFIVCGILLVNAIPLNNEQQQKHLLGAKQCTWGPSHWCKNLSNAKGCNAVRHCIQTVWEKQAVPVDNDSICQICKDMVTQARDQLRSNETMEELKEVFEGSCNLIPIKVVRKECDKLADDFIPELVEALSSQMNPDQVCSVAGLCNNAEIDKLLTSYYAGALDGTLKETDEASHEVVDPHVETKTKKPYELNCGNCNHLGSLITDKFNAANRDDILENILHLCGEMSSFSDACSNIVLTYFNDIYDHMKENLNSGGICHLGGACDKIYHQHPEDSKDYLKVDSEVASSVAGDDIPCELCVQLVEHLRDLLVANTTEAEFKQVLEGLCKQTKGFKDQCLSIVDEYYDEIYNTLKKELDPKGACFMIGICPKGMARHADIFQGPIMPLLPSLPPAEIKVTIRKKLGSNEPKFTQEELQSMALPIDRLMGASNPELLVENGELCTFCEYLLHFIQEALATPSTEDEIKREVNRICDKMPNTVRGQCHNFIDMYGDAVIALLIQGLNPREICPKMQMCPHNNGKRQDMEVFDPAPVDSAPIDESDKPTCPLCLFAVQQAQEKIKNDKSKKNIKQVLDHLCGHLPTKLQNECIDFVETYSSELIDMLITDFKPQEICVALKLCPKSNSYLSDLGLSVEDENENSSSSSEDDEAFNEIADDDMPIEIVFEKHDDVSSPPQCFICEEVIKKAEAKMGKHKTKEEIKEALEHSCTKLRKNLQQQCKKYVDKYGDVIAELILKEMAPKMICRELGLCLWSEQEDLEIDEALKYDVIAMPNTHIRVRPSDRLTGMDDIIALQEPPTCVLCEFVIAKIEMEMHKKQTQEEIKHTVEKICHIMPATISHSCEKFIDQYAEMIISMIGTVPPKLMCTRLELCMSQALEEFVSDEVIECGVCHGASMALLPYLRQSNGKASSEGRGTHELIAVACETLPAKYYQMCSEMVRIYGQSIMHLSEKNYVDESHICAEIGKCFETEKSSLAFARLTP